MAWLRIKPKDPANWDDVFVWYGDPDVMFIESLGYQITLSPDQREQLAYLLLKGKPMTKSKEEAAYELTKKFKEKYNN